MSTKSSNDAIGNRSCELPACSAVPQPTPLPRNPSAASRNGKMFPPSASICPHQYNSLNTRQPPRSTHYSYKDKRAKPCGRKTRVFFLQWHTMLLFAITVVCCHHIQHCALKEEFSVAKIDSEARVCAEGGDKSKNVF
jgi:hypothetical protein